MSRTISSLLRFGPVSVERIQRCREILEEAYPAGSESTWPNLNHVCAEHLFDIKMARWVFQEILAERAKELES